MTAPDLKQDLLNVVVKIVKSLLEQDGFVHPLGAVLGPGRHIKLIKPKNWKEHPTRTEVEGYWARVLGRQATGGVVCWCSGVLAECGTSELAEHILIHVEQQGDLSLDLFYPYEKTADLKVVLGVPRAVNVPFQIFDEPMRVN